MIANIKRCIQVANRSKRADVVLKGGTVVDIVMGANYQADVAIVEDTIVGVGDKYKGKTEIDCSGKYILPSFIDTDAHIEHSMLRPSQYVASIIKCGTTAIHFNPYQIVNTCGKSGIEFIRDELNKQPINYYMSVPFAVPSTSYETSAIRFNNKAIAKMLKSDKFFLLGEAADISGIDRLDKDYLSKIESAKRNNKFIDGYIDADNIAMLDGYCALGIRTNRSIDNVDIMQKCLQRGMYIKVSCELVQELPLLLKTITPFSGKRIVFCSHYKQANDILSKGHINSCLKKCVNSGMDVYTAIAMATLNGAECYGHNNRGLVCAGFLADIAIVDDLTSFNVNKTICNGELVFDNGKINYNIKNVQYDHIKSFNVRPVQSSAYNFNVDRAKIKNSTVKVNVIVLPEDGFVTSCEKLEMIVTADGDIELSNGIIKVALIERYYATGNVGLGLIKGFGIKKGAIATSISRDSNNIIVVGTNNIDMTIAVDAIIKSGGGVVICEDGIVKEQFVLPICGIMSDMDADYVASRQAGMNMKLQNILDNNVSVDVLQVLNKLSMSVLPNFRMTDRGLLDVVHQKIVKVLE